MISVRAPRRVLLPLFIYHVLVLVGGALLVLGIVDRHVTWTGVGLGLFVAGVALQIAVLRWSVRTISRARSSPSPGPGENGLGVSRVLPRKLCPACGWRGPRIEVYCPRCGRPTVGLAPSSPGA